MDVLRQLVDDARALIGDMSKTQQFAVFMLIGIVGALLTFAAYLGSSEAKSGKVPLSVRIPPDEAKAMIERLDAQGLGPAEMHDDLKIYVPVEKSADAYIFLAQENLLTPESGGGIREMLANWTFSTTRGQAEAMMRAGTGHDIARLIERIEVIKEARVMYSGAEQRSPFSPRSPKNAAVHVTTKFGKQLTQDTANIIINLVAAAESGLERKNVAITDQDGRHFYPEDANNLSVKATQIHQIEKMRNEEERDRIEMLLRQGIPGCVAWAFVDVEMDFRRRQTFRRGYEEGPARHVIQRKTREETTEEPGAETGSRPNVARSANLGESGNRKKSAREDKFSEQTRDNAMTEEWLEDAPTVKRKTVSAIVQLPWRYKRGFQKEDGSWVYADVREDGKPADYIPEADMFGKPVLDPDGKPLLRRFTVDHPGEEKKLELIQAVATAAAIPPEQVKENVHISYVLYPESPEFAVAPPGTTAQLWRKMRENVVPLFMLGVLLVSLFIIYMQARRALPHEEVELPEDQTMSMDLLTPMSEADQEHQAFEAMRAKIADAVAEDPTKAATLIRRWMTKENY